MREGWQGSYGKAIEALPNERGGNRYAKPKVAATSSLLYLKLPP
jgi:hypothetical protein